MKFEIIKYKKITSTNDIAMDLIKNGRKTIGCVYSETQTNGRGNHGKKWISQEGNLFLSFFFPLKKNFPPFNEFSIINPIIISEVLKNYCKNKDISFKFPNDIFVSGKKICGILQETIKCNNINFLIVGIGLNIISSPKVIEYPTTNILFESKERIKLLKIVNDFIKSYEFFFNNLKSYNFLDFKNKLMSTKLDQNL
jgi:BirA family transcriptional regulator, biotin operon repressor / biotin---[acetyl-CoA-carboxylase] ligase